MKSGALEVRFEATYALGVLGPPLVRAGAFRDGKAAVDRLLALMQDADPAMRLAATHVLGAPDGHRETIPGAQPGTPGHQADGRRSDSWWASTTRTRSSGSPA